LIVSPLNDTNIENHHKSEQEMEDEYNFVNLQALNPEQLLFFQKYFMSKYPKYEGSWKSENIPDVFITEKKKGQTMTFYKTKI
jgi:hypothetical protein